MHRYDPAWQRNLYDSFEKAKRHVRFCFGFYKQQDDLSTYVLHEHPWNACSWGLVCIRQVELLKGVEGVRLDTCPRQRQEWFSGASNEAHRHANELLVSAARIIFEMPTEP